MFVIDKNKLADLISPTVKDDPFSLDALIAWLETKPADEAYQYCDTGRCLFSQFGEHLGLGAGREAYFAYLLKHGITYETWKCRMTEPFGNVAVESPETFGAALQRAKALRALSLQTGGQV